MEEKTNSLRFGGEETIPFDLREADIVVLPICYENMPSYGEGSREGPIHILKASRELECLDEETFFKWTDLKIHTLPPIYPSDDPERAMGEILKAAKESLKGGKRLLALGGDHAISIGTIAAASEQYEGLGVLQIDAHLDLRDRWNGSKYNHACVMRRVTDDMRLPAVQVGIRAISPEELEFIKKKKMSPFFAHKIRPWDDSWMEKVVEELPEKVYVTLDVDGLDPGEMPGTGTPEPGGLSYGQVTDLLKLVGEKREVVAADINELAKIPGSLVSEFTAAKLAMKIFVYCLSQ